MPASSRGQTGGYPAWITRRSRQVLVVAALVTLIGGYLAWHLKLRTAISELLPSKDPGVMTLTRTQNRIGDMSLLLVGIHSPDKAANERYAQMVTEKLRALPGRVLSLATYNVRDVKDFFEKNKWLYVAEDDLESIRDRLRTEISKRKNPLFVSLTEDEPIDSMQKRIGNRNKMDDRFPDGLFASASGDYMWVAALPPGGLFVEHAGESLYHAAQRDPRAEPDRQLSPPDDRRGRGSGGDRDRHPAGDRERHQVGDRDLPLAGGGVDRPLLPQAARDRPDRRPRRHRRGHRVRGRRPGVRVPDVVDGIPGVDHPR